MTDLSSREQRRGSGVRRTFDLVGLQVEVLQRRADGGDPLQPVEAQVQLHQAGHVEGVGGDAGVRELVVSHPHVLQLAQTGQEALWEGLDGVVLHVELVQLFGERVWDLWRCQRLERPAAIIPTGATSANR